MKVKIQRIVKGVGGGGGGYRRFVPRLAMQLVFLQEIYLIQFTSPHKHLLHLGGLQFIIAEMLFAQ